MTFYFILFFFFRPVASNTFRGKTKNCIRTPWTAEAFSLLEEFIQAPLQWLLTEGLNSTVTWQGNGRLRGSFWDSPSLGWRALHGVRLPRSSPLCSPLQSGTINCQREEPLYLSTLHLSPSACLLAFWLVGWLAVYLQPATPASSPDPRGEWFSVLGPRQRCNEELSKVPEFSLPLVLINFQVL